MLISVFKCWLKKLGLRVLIQRSCWKENGTETQVCRPPYFILLSQSFHYLQNEAFIPQTYQEASSLCASQLQTDCWEKTAVAQHSLGGFLASLSPQSSVPLWCHTPSGNLKNEDLYGSHRKGLQHLITWLLHAYSQPPYDPWYPCQPIEFILQSLHRGFITWKVDELRTLSTALRWRWQHIDS